MGNSQTGPRFNSSTTAEEAATDLNLKDKICIVTGSNTGIGKETVRVLAKRNGTIIMACRSIERGNEAKKDIIANLKQTDANFDENKIKVMELDLGSLQSVKKFAENYDKEYKQLHYLINNAGIMALPQWEPTKENYEMQFGTNHIGHYYLTLLLTNKLIESKPSRVINVSSDAHKQCPNPFLTNIKEYIKTSDGPLKSNYSPWTNYGISKASNILFSREYNRRYAKLGVQSVSLHPGVIPTDLTRNTSTWIAGLIKSSITRPFLKTIPQGAATTVRCCSLKDEELQGGHFYKDCNEANALLHQQFRLANNVNYNNLSDEQVKDDPSNLLWQVTEKLITQRNFTFNLNDNSEQKDNSENNDVLKINNNNNNNNNNNDTNTLGNGIKTNDNSDNTNNDNNNNNNNNNQVIEEEATN